MYFIKKLNNLKNNLNFKLPKFGRRGGTSRYKNIIIFIIFLLSISIRSFGSETTEPNYNTTTKQYEISSKEELYWFAKMINGELANPKDRTTNAILTKDIEFNTKDGDPAKLEKWRKYDWQKYGRMYAAWLYKGAPVNEEPKIDELEELTDYWTSIGKDEDHKYTGTFDGDGHSISGLFCNVENYRGGAYAGLFGVVGEGGKVKNLGIEDSFIRSSGVGSGSGGGLVASCVGNVTSSYIRGCKVVVFGCGYDYDCDGYGGGLIGSCSGIVTNCYSSDCMIDVCAGAYGYGGGLIGECRGSVTNCYSSNIEITSNFSRGGICGELNSGTISNCYYLKDGELNKDLFGIGGTSSDTESRTKSATVEEFKNGTVRDKLNKGVGSNVFKLNSKEDGHRYLLLDWEPEVELKIPVRVKINYDPSNNLESLVSKDFKHEFFRKKTGSTNWEEMFQNIHYYYEVSPVEGSIKINSDGSKTQDFIFSYYIYHAKDSSGKDYKFGFNKKYPVNTY
ncbi:MAG: hypothetical protein J6C55_04060, partial [Oscillospiraceae bacterium]|nr:hypothetical protein [Oscillospiraceae bacterium]